MHHPAPVRLFLAALCFLAFAPAAPAWAQQADSHEFEGKLVFDYQDPLQGKSGVMTFWLRELSLRLSIDYDEPSDLEQLGWLLRDFKPEQYLLVQLAGDTFAMEFRPNTGKTEYTFEGLHVTGRTRELGGYTCREAVAEGPDGRVVYWIAEELPASMQFHYNHLVNFAYFAPFLKSGLSGFPLYVAVDDSSGNPYFRLQLREVQPQPLDVRDFMVPLHAPILSPSKMAERVQQQLKSYEVPAD